MFVLHDIYLECNGLSAQIDYLVVTRFNVYIIECKNLVGNIEIDNTGKFIRTYEVSGKKYKEGIYSPITQNERHLGVIKALRLESKSNPITKALLNKNFDSAYKSLVVLANPKTYLNDKFAKKEVKQKVIRADQLIETIHKIDSLAESVSMSEDEMRKLAEFFLDKSIPNKSDYSVFYEKTVAEQTAQSKNNSTPPICPKCGGKLLMRVAKSGSNTGNRFLGCSNYPNCKFTKNV